MTDILGSQSMEPNNPYGHITAIHAKKRSNLMCQDPGSLWRHT